MVAAAQENQVVADTKLQALLRQEQLRPLRLPMRIHLHRMARANPAHAAEIERVMDNGNLAGELEAHVQMMMQDQGAQHLLFEPAAATTEPGAPAPQRPILNWLWAHRQEILQFILSIVGTLGGTAGAAGS